MLDGPGRFVSIAVKRAQSGRNPFVFSYGKTPEHKWLAKRRRREAGFRRLCLGSIILSCLFLCFLLFTIVGNGYSVFVRTQILLPVTFSADVIGTDTSGADYRKLVKNALEKLVPAAESHRDRMDLYALSSKEAYYHLRTMVMEDPSLIGQTRDLWLPASSNVDLFIKRHGMARSTDLGNYKISGNQYIWLRQLLETRHMRTVFNTGFFTRGDSQEPESAGIFGSFIGSLFTVLICMLCSFPLGVATALYLEEFARKSWFTELIEININNLAAVPSIIYGLLGLSIYINVLHMPRCSALVGGLVLALLVLPVIVIATRNALRSVPRSIRFAAMAMGATPVQVALNHTLLYALPGIMTGLILSVARALGETSPLLMIGMVAFITNIPRGITDPATTLPVQVYLWANNPETGFVENTAGAIIVLLALLAVINFLAAWVRRKYEIKW